MTTLLVITTGQTDVQLVVDGGRQKLSARDCASLHDDIAGRIAEWRLMNSPRPKVGGDDARVLPQGNFILCTPKLDAVLQYAEDNNITLNAALILETRRGVSSDPRSAGTVLARRLRENGVADVCEAPYLVEEETLEDVTEPRDSVIRRVVVARIVAAIRERFESLGPKQVLVAATGGFSAVAPLVEEIVRLYAAPDGEVRTLEVADGARAKPPAEDRAVPRTTEPAASYQARWHALTLIDKGNLLGAWGAVQHLHKDEVEKRWTKVIEWLARFAASLPIGPECDIAVLEHPRKAVRAALRVELALRASDVPRAVHGTVAFFEAALWDHLRPYVTRHPEKGEYYKVCPAPNSNLVRDGSTDDGKRPFDTAKGLDEGPWYRVNDGKICGTRLAKRYLQKASLEKLGQAVDDVRDLRNDVAHNEPTSELMEDAHRRMVDKGLWSAQGTFLTQPLVQTVLRELGEQHPENLCASLVRTVRARLLGVDQPLVA